MLDKILSRRYFVNRSIPLGADSLTNFSVVRGLQGASGSFSALLPKISVIISYRQVSGCYNDRFLLFLVVWPVQSLLTLKLTLAAHGIAWHAWLCQGMFYDLIGFFLTLFTQVMCRSWEGAQTLGVRLKLNSAFFLFQLQRKKKKK